MHRPAARPSLLHRAGSAAAGIGRVGHDRPRLRVAIQVGLIVLIFGVLAAVVAGEAGSLPDYHWRLHGGWLMLAFASTSVAYVLGAELWRWMLRALGEDIARANARSIYAKSLIARYVPTSVLMVVGRIVMAERLGVSKRACLASIVYETALGMATAGIVGSYFLITLPAFEDYPARYGVLVLIPVAIGCLHPRVFHPLADRVLAKLGREPLPRVLSFARVLALGTGYLAQWAAFGVGVFAFASALQPMALSDLLFVTAAFAVAFCVGVLTFVAPGGLGTREAAFAAVLGPVLPVTAAVAVAVGSRLLQVAVELIYLGVSVALERRAGRGVRSAARAPG